MAAPPPGNHSVIIVRHAKAEDSATKDHARRLTDRGRADAAAIGELLGELLVHDAETVALVSSAARAQETWQTAAEALDDVVELRELDELYDAGPEEIVDLLAQLPEQFQVAIVVGHNPAMQAVAHQLEDGDDDELSDRLERGLPTAGLVLLELDAPWTQLETGSCRLVRVDKGRG